MVGSNHYCKHYIVISIGAVASVLYKYGGCPLVGGSIIGGFTVYTLFAIADNELPDYIMVMLANNKTVHQINNDLQLFLGENTDRFTAWLQRAINDPDSLLERETSDGRKDV